MRHFAALIQPLPAYAVTSRLKMLCCKPEMLAKFVVEIVTQYTMQTPNM